MIEIQKRPILKLNLRSQPEIIKTVIQKEETPNKPQVKPANFEPRLPLNPSKKLLLSVEECTDLLAKVQKKYPKTFPAKNNPKVILAIGIHKELANGLEISMGKARKFCAIYCNKKSYKDARVLGAKRYDLEGNIVGEVLC
jgi:ProP effector